MELLKPRRAAATTITRIQQHVQQLYLRLFATFRLGSAASRTGMPERLAARLADAGRRQRAGVGRLTAAQVLVLRETMRAATAAAAATAARHAEPALRRAGDTARRHADAAPRTVTALRGAPGARGLQGAGAAVTVAGHIGASPPAPLSRAVGRALPSAAGSSRRGTSEWLVQRRNGADGGVLAQAGAPATMARRGAAGGSSASERALPAVAPARSQARSQPGRGRMGMRPLAARAAAAVSAAPAWPSVSGVPANAPAPLAPGALTPYAPPTPQARVLRDSGRAAAAALHTRVESVLQTRLQTVERHVHSQVVREIAHGAAAQERVREVVGETLFSPRVLTALADRMYGALERRGAIERYRRGTG